MTLKPPSTFTVVAMVDELLKIGELAQRQGVSTATLRYYERLGLLGQPDRSTSGYRVYGTDDEERVRFIVRAKALDLSLDEIRSLLDVWDEGGCADTREQLRHVVAHKVAEARWRAMEAEAFASQLVHVYERLSEPAAASGDGCRCIPDLPVEPTADLAAELSRITHSGCSCGGGCGWSGCDCGCACCGADALDVTRRRSTGGEGGDNMTITHDESRVHNSTPRPSCTCCGTTTDRPTDADAPDAVDNVEMPASASCGCGCGGACGCGA